MINTYMIAKDFVEEEGITTKSGSQPYATILKVKKLLEDFREQSFESRTGHRLYQCSKKHEDGGVNCPYCEGGLSSCIVCDGTEGSLPSECPGRKMTEEEQDAVYKGILNYVDHHWVRLALVIHEKGCKSKGKYCSCKPSPIIPENRQIETSQLDAAAQWVFDRRWAGTKFQDHVELCPTFGKGDYNHCQCCVCRGCTYHCVKWEVEEKQRIKEKLQDFFYGSEKHASPSNSVQTS